MALNTYNSLQTDVSNSSDDPKLMLVKKIHFFSYYFDNIYIEADKYLKKILLNIYNTNLFDIYFSLCSAYLCLSKSNIYRITTKTLDVTEIGRYRNHLRTVSKPP